MKWLGNFAEDATVRIFFTTNDAAGAAVAPSDPFEAADIDIYKDGSATQKATTNGLTMTSPFDSVTGLHLLEIDTSNDTGDSGFWATGSDYTVVLTPDETVAGQTVVAVLGQFSIENRFTGNDLSAAQVNAEVDTALQDIHLDHLIQSADPGGVVADSSFLAKLTSKSATPSFSSYDPTTDSLEAVRDRGDAAWTTGSGGDATAANQTTILNRLPAALVGGRMDASIGAVASGAITSGAFATDAIPAIAIAAAAANKLADHIWRRNSANIAASADGDAVIFRSPLGAARKLHNRSRFSGGNLQVFEEDDATVAGTQAATTSAGADPVTELDTA